MRSDVHAPKHKEKRRSGEPLTHQAPGRPGNIRRWLGTAALFAAIAATSVGCTVIPSAVTAFPESSGPAATAPETDTERDPASAEQAAAARAAVEEALRAMESDEADRFWFTGYIRNTMEKHQITSMFDGVVLLPKEAYLINARIAGQPYQYYRYEGQNYIKNNDRWYPVSNREPMPIDLLRGFEDWLPVMDTAVKKPDDAVLGNPVDVYELRISGKEWVQGSSSELFADLAARVDSEEALQQLLEETIVKVTIKIGKNDRFIHEYETWIVMPLPGGGYVDQVTFMRLYRFGDPSIETQQIPLPKDIENWIEQHEDDEEADGELIEEG